MTHGMIVVPVLIRVRKSWRKNFQDGNSVVRYRRLSKATNPHGGFLINKPCLFSFHDHSMIGAENSVDVALA